MSGRDRDTLDLGLAQLHQQLMRSLGLPQAPRQLTDAEILARLQAGQPTQKKDTPHG